MTTDRAPQPTIACPACHGSGIDNARVWAYLQGRAAVDDAARDREIQCPTCVGRGRITIAHALASGYRVNESGTP